MGGINIGRLILGSIVAGIVIFVIEGLASTIYSAELMRSLQEHNLGMSMDAKGIALGALNSLLLGFGMVFFYAASRPRFGAGVRTAIIVAVLMSVSGLFVGLIGYYMIGLYPPKMLLQWAAVGLIETNLACIAGAWLYRE